VERLFRPAFGADDGGDFVTQRLDKMRVGDEVNQRLGD
jgi:hypothetical protein